MPQANTYPSGTPGASGNKFLGVDSTGAVKLFAEIAVLATTQTASFTLAATDNQSTIYVNSASAVTITLPNSLTVNFGVTIVQLGAGQVTFTAASGATLNARLSATKTAAQYAIASLLVSGNSGGTSAVYILSGDVV